MCQKSPEQIAAIEAEQDRLIWAYLDASPEYAELLRMRAQMLANAQAYRERMRLQKEHAQLGAA
jgi:hypothetical protein